MLCLLLVALFVLTASLADGISQSAARNPGESESAAPGKSPCCTPPQWSGQVRVLLSEDAIDNITLTEVSMEIQYDEPNQRIAAAGVMKKGKDVLDIKIVRNYKEGESYFIMKTGCFKIPIGKKFEKVCVPDGAELEGVLYYGDPGSPRGSLWADSWRLETEAWVVTLTTSQASCALVTYNSFSTTAVSASTATFVNQTNVVNPAFFKHPAKCPPAEEVPFRIPVIDIGVMRFPFR